MEMSISELADRFTILKLKVERLPDNNDIIQLYDVFLAELEASLVKLDKETEEKVRTKIKLLYKYNAITWDLEAEIRNGNIDDLKEMGRRTILIRENNACRVRIKNNIAVLIGEKHGIDYKVDHLSEK